MNEIFVRLGQQALSHGPNGFLALILLMVFWGTGAMAKRLLGRIGEKMNRERSEILNLAGSATKGALILFGAVTALGTVGVNVSALVAGLGLTGFALGFALRDALSNLLAGALIVIYHPFQIGDLISVSGSEGMVKEINLRYTVLQGEEQTFLIPNSILFTNTISLKKTEKLTTVEG